MIRSLLVIGCNNYEYINDLNSAEKDANDIYDILIKPEYGEYSPEHSKILFSPTLSEVLEALDSLLFINDSIDTFTFYFAGHGGIGSGSYYVCLGDTNNHKLSTTALGMGSLFSIINESTPRQTNIIIDACQAGGITYDLHSLLNPEILGGANTSSISIFLSSAADQYASEDENGGRATQHLIKIISGCEILQTQTPFYDLTELGRNTSEALSLSDKDQTPISWGLNLLGESRFSRNPNFGGTKNLPIRELTNLQPGTDVSKSIQSMSEGLWKIYIDIPKIFIVSDLYDVLKKISDQIVAESLSPHDFLDGFSQSLVSRAKLSKDLFRGTESVACCCMMLLHHESTYKNNTDTSQRLINRCYESALESLNHTHDLTLNHKYSLLGLTAGFSDIFHLPIRISKILGWIGFTYIASLEISFSIEFPEKKMRELVNSILDQYACSIVSMSDTQSPYLAVFFSACKRLGWVAEAEQCVGLLFNSCTSAKGNIAYCHLPSKSILDYLLCRNSGDFSSNYKLLAKPTELLSVILSASSIFDLNEVVDPYLKKLDHTSFNLFIPNSYSCFSQPCIEDGINKTFQIGHGVWEIEDFQKIYDTDINPLIEKDENIKNPIVAISAIISSFTLPDRTPWFILK